MKHIAQWNQDANTLSEVAWANEPPSWLDLEALPEVKTLDGEQVVPSEVWRGVLAQGQILFDHKGDWGERYNEGRSKFTGSETQEEPYTREERAEHIARIERIFAACDPDSLEHLALALWETWEQVKYPVDRAWIPPTLAMFPGTANAYRVLAFHLKLSDCYLIRNIGNQESARILFDSGKGSDSARYVLAQSLRRMREDYERKAVRKALEADAEAAGVDLDDWLDGAEPEFGLDEKGHHVFDMGSRQIQMSCDLGSRSITWTELPGKTVKGFPRKKKADDAEAFALARLRYRSMKEELERAFL